METVTERKALTLLLNDPKQMRNFDIDVNWFIERNHQDIVEGLKATQGEINEYYDLLKPIKEINPFTKVDMSYLAELKFDAHFGARLETELGKLHNSYLDREIIHAAKDLTTAPSRKNLIYLEQLMDEKAKAEAKEDEGIIEPLADQLRDRFENDLPEGLKSYGKLDMAFNGGLRGGKLLILAARPGIGKSAFAVNFSDKILERNQNVRMDLFILEMSALSMLERFVSKRTGLTSMKILRPKIMATPKEREQMEASFRYYENQDMRIFDKKHNLDDIIRTIRRRAEGQKNYIAIVDYLGLVSVSDKRKQAYERVSEITNRLKQLTNELDIPILLLAQLNREVRPDQQPQLSHLRDSGSIEQDANVVMFLHETDDNGAPITQLTIAKNREGTTGKIDYRFEKEKMTFSELYHT